MLELRRQRSERREHIKFDFRTIGRLYFSTGAGEGGGLKARERRRQFGARAIFVLPVWLQISYLPRRNRADALTIQRGEMQELQHTYCRLQSILDWGTLTGAGLVFVRATSIMSLPISARTPLTSKHGESARNCPHFVHSH